MKSTDVIKKAILSEKAYKLMEKGIYTFLVDYRATKNQIAQAVKKQFSVDVKRVNILAVASKKKRVGRTRKFTDVGGGKKAHLTLAPGQNIPMLSPKKEGKAKKATSKKAEGPVVDPERSRREQSRRGKDVEKTSAVEGPKASSSLSDLGVEDLSKVEGKE